MSFFLNGIGNYDCLFKRKTLPFLKMVRI